MTCETRKKQDIAPLCLLKYTQRMDCYYKTNLSACIPPVHQTLPVQQGMTQSGKGSYRNIYYTVGWLAICLKGCQHSDLPIWPKERGMHPQVCLGVKSVSLSPPLSMCALSLRLSPAVGPISIRLCALFNPIQSLRLQYCAIMEIPIFLWCCYGLRVDWAHKIFSEGVLDAIYLLFCQYNHSTTVTLNYTFVS